MRNENAAKKIFKDSFVKRLCYKNGFWKLSKIEMFFQKQNVYLGKKAELTTSNDIKGVHEKNCSAMTRSMVETGKFYIKLYMFIFTRGNSSYLPQVFFSLELLSHFC